MDRNANNKIVFIIQLIYPLLVSVLGYFITKNLTGIGGAILLGFFLYIPIILFDSSVNVYYLIFYIANERMFIIDGFPIGLIAVYVIFLFCKTLIFEKLRLNMSFLFISLLMLIFMLLKGTVQSASLIDTEVIRHIFNIYIFITIVKINRYNLTEFSLNLGTWFYYGVMVASLVGIYDSVVESKEIVFSNFFRLIPVNQDPNYFGIELAIAISVLIVKLSLGLKKNYKEIFFIILFFAFGFMTQSRAFLIMSIPNIALLISVFSKQKINNKLSILITSILAGLVAFQLGFLDVFERTLGRLKYAGLEDVRLVLWSQYIEVLTMDIKNFLFGIGKRYDVTTLRLAPHNFLIGSWVYYGFFLTILIILSYFFLIYNFRKNYFKEKWKVHYYLSFVVVLIGYSFLDGIIDNLFFYGISLSLASAYLLSENKKGVLNDENLMVNQHTVT